MSRAFDFGHLVALCRRTHDETRRSAARAADTYLVSTSVSLVRLRPCWLKGTASSRSCM